MCYLLKWHSMLVRYPLKMSYVVCVLSILKMKYETSVPSTEDDTCDYLSYLRFVCFLKIIPNYLLFLISN